MKKSVLLLCLLLMTSCAHVSNNPNETASPTSVYGWWAGEFYGSYLLFNFKIDGDVLTGTVDGLSGIPLLHLRDGKDDVIAVLYSLKLKKPLLVGHSLAGEELSSVASRFPDRISGLIYLDSAYAYAFDVDGSLEKIKEDFRLEANVPRSWEASSSSSEAKPVLRMIAMSNRLPSGSATPESVRRMIAKTSLPPGSVAPENVPRMINPPAPSDLPESEMRQQRIGTYEEKRRAIDAIHQGMKSFKNILVKCLAIFADLSVPEPLKNEAGPEVKAQIDRIKSNMPDFLGKLVTAFVKGVPNARVPSLRISLK